MKELILLITVLSCIIVVFTTIKSMRKSSKNSNSLHDCLNRVNKFPAIIIPLECGILLLIIDTINFGLRFILICSIIVIINMSILNIIKITIKQLDLKNGGEK